MGDMTLVTSHEGGRGGGEQVLLWPLYTTVSGPVSFARWLNKMNRFLAMTTFQSKIKFAILHTYFKVGHKLATESRKMMQACTCNGQLFMEVRTLLVTLPTRYITLAFIHLVAVSFIFGLCLFSVKSVVSGVKTVSQRHVLQNGRTNGGTVTCASKFSQKSSWLWKTTYSSDL